MSGGIHLPGGNIPDLGATAQMHAQMQEMQKQSTMQFIDMAATMVYAQLVAAEHMQGGELETKAKIANNAALTLAQVMGKISINKEGK